MLMEYGYSPDRAPILPHSVSRLHPAAAGYDLVFPSSGVDGADRRHCGSCGYRRCAVLVFVG